MIPFSKSWQRYLVILTIALLAALAFSGFIAYRLAKNDAGICIPENRVISAEKTGKPSFEAWFSLELATVISRKRSFVERRFGRE